MDTTTDHFTPLALRMWGNYCFKQELHKLLWFNDNDKDNINEMKLFENRNFLSPSGHATSGSTTFGTSEFVPVADCSASGHSARNLVLLNLVPINLVLLNLVHLNLIFCAWSFCTFSFFTWSFCTWFFGIWSFFIWSFYFWFLYTAFNIDIEEVLNKFSQCHPHRLCYKHFFTITFTLTCSFLTFILAGVLY